MKRITRSSILVGVALALTMTSIALGAPKAEKSSKYLTVSGRVLEINRKERTLLVSDWRSQKLYQVIVEKNATFKITFGTHMNLTQAGFDDVSRNDKVEMHCVRTGEERLARLDDGREVILVSAAR